MVNFEFVGSARQIYGSDPPGQRKKLSGQSDPAREVTGGLRSMTLPDPQDFKTLDPTRPDPNRDITKNLDPARPDP